MFRGRSNVCLLISFLCLVSMSWSSLILVKFSDISSHRVFNCHPGGKAVYIAPLKALVRERVDDWRERMEWKLGKKVVELTGDSSPDIRAIERADVIVTTPEKWDGVSRSWQNRFKYPV